MNIPRREFLLVTGLGAIVVEGRRKDIMIRDFRF